MQKCLEVREHSISEQITEVWYAWNPQFEMVVRDKMEKLKDKFMKGLSQDRELGLYAKGHGKSSMSFKSESDMLKF